MWQFILASLVSGLVFGVLDGLINANPLARKLLGFYTPLARKSVNLPVGLILDLIYGFVMAGIFLLLYPSLPGGSGFLKGLSYGGILWFFRVVMYAGSQWMILEMPLSAVTYLILAGGVEMAVLGMIYGLIIPF